MKSQLLPVALLVFAAGCTTTEFACTDDARVSMTLTVVDEAGTAIPSAIVSFSVDGGDIEECQGPGDGTFGCGLEQIGEFEVTIEALGYGTDVFTQTIESDECHVLTEVIERELQPVNCTDEEVPSIDVTVTDTQGLDVTGGDVVWYPVGEDGLAEPCMSQGANNWTCGTEDAGDLVVEISNGGPYELYSEIVTVGFDECHVITENLDAVLEYLPD